MSDATNTSNTDGNQTSEETSTAGDEFKPITSQEDLNKVISERITRERAKFSDYKDVKAKAAQYEQLEESQKSEIQRATDKATAAERERDEARSEAMRLRVAAKFGISDEDADLFLTGKDEDSLTAQARRLSDREAANKKTNHVAREGDTSTRPGSSEEAQVLQKLFKGGD